MKKWQQFFGILGVAALLTACRGTPAKENETSSKEAAWLTTWSQSQKGIGLFPENDNGHTALYEVPIQTDGKKVELTLGNYYGENDMTVSGLSVSTEKNQGYQQVMIDGEEEAVVAAGELVQTDPIPITTSAGESLFVRIYYKNTDEANRAASGNTLAKSAERSKAGDFTLKEEFPVDQTFVDQMQDPFANKFAEELAQGKFRFVLTLAGVDVQSENSKGTIVAFGDSITEQGFWVNPLQEKVNKDFDGKYSVVNAGISGNRLLRGLAGIPRRAQFFGIAGTERFQNDVFDMNENVKAVIVSIGVNDLHQPGSDDPFPLDEIPTYEEMIAGYEEMIQLAKDKKSKIFLGTITPFVGYKENPKNDEKEKIRQTINQWIRENQEVDGVIDFDRAIADPQKPDYLMEKYDSGDKLHPNEVGGKAMFEEIKVSELE